jgi:hypothetical protein
MVAWDPVTRRDVVRAIEDYDRLGPDRFCAEHGFGPAKRYLLVYNDRRYPSKRLLRNQTAWVASQPRCK